MTRHELVTEQEMTDLREIDVLMDEANTHAMTLGDGGWKSSEGHVSIGFGNHWDRDPEEPRKPITVEVYSYLLGPHRSHFFDNTTEALEVVRQWHRNEMAYDYTTEDWDDGAREPDLYSQLEQKRREEADALFRAMDALMEEECGDKPDAAHTCTQPKGHDGPHTDFDNPFQWKATPAN